MDKKGRTYDSLEHRGLFDRMRRAKIRSVLAILAMTDFAHCIVQEAQFVGAPTVIESYRGNSDVMHLNPTNTFCLIFHGLGLDNSEEIADAYLPIMRNRCQIALVHYSPNGIDGGEIARRLSKYFDEHISNDNPIKIVSFGESAGGIVHYHALKALMGMRSDIDIRAMINDGSPTGSIDTKGPLEGAVVEAGAVLADTPLRFSISAKPIQYAAEFVSRNTRNSAMNDNDRRRLDIGDIRYVVDETDAQVYLAVLEAIRDFPETDQDSSFLQDTAFYYLRATDPEKDGNVDVDAAGYNWMKIIGHAKTIEIPDGGHANPRQAPGYIRIVDDILQEVIVESYSDRRALSDTSR